MTLSKSKIVLLISAWIFIIFTLVTMLFFTVIYVPTESMSPTIAAGDRAIVVKSYNHVSRGDIIMFERDDSLLVKRVIGLPGEKISIINGIVYVNGNALQEDYVKVLDDFTGYYTIPDDSYFVLGDNRTNSKDSRYFTDPYVTSDTIVGKIIYFL